MINTYHATDGELVFENNNGNKMLKLDNSGNVIRNFSGNPNSVANADIHGAVTRPDTTNVTGAVVEWTEIVDNIPQKFVKYTDGRVYQMVARTGPTTARPTSPYYGQQYYDITLNKPIWFNGYMARWEDALGNPV